MHRLYFFYAVVKPKRSGFRGISSPLISKYVSFWPFSVSQKWPFLVHYIWPFLPDSNIMYQKRNFFPTRFPNLIVKPHYNSKATENSIFFMNFCITNTKKTVVTTQCDSDSPLHDQNLIFISSSITKLLL